MRDSEREDRGAADAHRGSERESENEHEIDLGLEFLFVHHVIVSVCKCVFVRV